MTFNLSAAVDAGDYVGQFVHQKCFVVRNREWTVFFRPDADGTRDEVVVERGKMWLEPGETPSHILHAYQATILKNGKVLAHVTVPRHWWMARWRWQSAPRPVRRSLADLVAMRVICPLGKDALYEAILDPSAGGELFADCSAQKMGVFAIRVLAGGALLGQAPSAHTLKTPYFPLALFERDASRAHEIRATLGDQSSMTEHAIRFVLSHSAVTSALPRSPSATTSAPAASTSTT
jgi:hypothetical protein